jgi:hypothetical protein
MTEETKVCTKCGSEKPLSAFGKRGGVRGDQLESQCRSCRSIRHKENRLSKIEQYLARARDYRKNNPDKMCEKSRREYLFTKQTNYEKLMLSRAKARAKQNGLEFSITMEDIVIPYTCPVLGIPIIKTLYYGGKDIKARDNSPSLDRIDSTKGYVKGNIRVISWRANWIKNYGTAEEHRKIAEYIEKNLPIDNEDYCI